MTESCDAWVSWEPNLTEPENESKKQLNYAYSIVWMLEEAVEREDIRLIAENIPTVTHLDAILVISRHPAFLKLVMQIRALTLPTYTEETGAAAIALLRAASHIVVADPVHCYHNIWLAVGYASLEDTDPPEFCVLWAGLYRLCLRCQRTPTELGSQEFFERMTTATIAAEADALRRIKKPLHPITAELLPTLLILSGTCLPEDRELAAFCIESLPQNDFTFFAASTIISQTFENHSSNELRGAEEVARLWEKKFL